jgi:CBS domain-containing protein
MLKLRDIMTHGVVTLSPETTLREAAAVLSSRHLTGAPVVAGSKVVGVVTMTDIIDFQADTPGAPSSEEEDGTESDAFVAEALDSDDEDEATAAYFAEQWEDESAELYTLFDAEGTSKRDVLGEHTVSEVMTRVVRAMSPDATVEQAADEMRRLGIHRLLVTGHDELLGIVTTTDIASAVADHKLHVRQYVFDRRGGDENRESDF